MCKTDSRQSQMYNVYNIYIIIQLCFCDSNNSMYSSIFHDTAHVTDVCEICCDIRGARETRVMRVQIL